MGEGRVFLVLNSSLIVALICTAINYFIDQDHGWLAWMGIGYFIGVNVCVLLTTKKEKK